jgi:hypothetical protein
MALTRSKKKRLLKKRKHSVAFPVDRSGEVVSGFLLSSEDESEPEADVSWLGLGSVFI